MNSIPHDDLLEAQEKIFQLTETIQTINELAIKLSNLLTAEDPIKYIATIIREIPGVFAVSMSTYQPNTQELIVEYLALPPEEKGVLARINKMIGRSLIGMHIPVSAEMYERMCAEVITTVGDIHEVTFGEIPKSIASLLKHTFGLNKLYGLALADNEGLLGTIIIVMHKEAEPLTDSVRLMLSRLGAVTLRRTLYEKHLKASEAKFRSYVDYAPTGILVVDRNGRYQEINPAAAHMLGYEEAELLALSIYNVVDPDYLAQGMAHFQKVVETGRATGEYKLRRKDNAAIWAFIDAVRLSDNRFMAFLLDVTARREAEEAHQRVEAQLRQSQKIESIGRLAGGIAHDFNNLLTVIQMYGDLMVAQMDESDPLLPKLEQIRQASQRASNLTNQLLAFSRKQILDPTIINLNDLITNLQKMLSRLIGEDILLSIVLQPDLWTIKADSGQIEQVIMNLVVNARDAMPTGGQLTIETSNIHLNEEVLTSKIEALTGPCVMLTISDTGEGMDAAIRQQIFEPFFTTKKVGSGTGLGLAMVHGIVRQSGGTIFVYSKPGQGTTFRIYLPASPEYAEPMKISSSEATYDAAEETILLVEDEDALRQLVCTTLEELGYSVLDAKDGFAALTLTEQLPYSIDMLLTDVVMPQMSGRELAEQLTQKAPQLKVLFMSGHTDDAVLRHGILTAQVDFLPKPFSKTTLAEKVRSVLNK